MAPVQSVVLALSCADKIGVVHAVTGYLGDHRLNIVESQQFGDAGTGQFFLRIQAEPVGSAGSVEELRSDFEPLARRFEMTWGLHDAARRPALLLLVSKLGHCLNDLLYRHQTGALAVEIPAIVSNHPDLAEMAEMYGIAFHHLPVTADTKRDQEAAVVAMVDDLGVDLVVLARYMQILTPFIVDQLPSRIINIHHGLLPGFEGASPHRQAFDAGVKVIGATAHYVTSELDRGPIIEQTTARIDHSIEPGRIASMTRDLECLALARAVQWQVEHRVLRNGAKTVVFA
ncbi:MAG: formyltetrahydrofolate deformylase [Acidimicrobiales bacterium]